MNARNLCVFGSDGVFGRHSRNSVYQNEPARQQFVRRFKAIRHLLDGTCTESILPLLAETLAIQSTLAGLGIDLDYLIATEGWVPEAQSLGSVLYYWRSRIDTRKRGATSNQKFIVVARTEQPRFNTNKMPDIGCFLRLHGIHSDRAPPHLVREHEGTYEAGKHQRIDTRRIPAFSQQGFRSHQHGY